MKHGVELRRETKYTPPMKISQEGKFCFDVVSRMARKYKSAGMNILPIDDAINILELAGWKHSLTNQAQKRKHLYEVLRREYVAGTTDLYVEGPSITFKRRLSTR